TRPRRARFPAVVRATNAYPPPRYQARQCDDRESNLELCSATGRSACEPRALTRKGRKAGRNYDLWAGLQRKHVGFLGLGPAVREILVRLGEGLFAAPAHNLEVLLHGRQLGAPAGQQLGVELVAQI